MYGGSGEDSGWAELLSAAVGPPGAEQVSGVQFCQAHEVLWAGTESGSVYSLQFPLLERYASVRAHTGRVADMAVLGDGLVSISADMLRYHAVGGLPRLSLSAPEGAEMLACSRESLKNDRVAVVCSDQTIASYDTRTAKLTAQASLEGGADIVRGPGVRGLLGAGAASGDLLLLDPASGFKVEARLPAHAGGVVALDMRGDMVITAGLGLRHGQPVVERAVRIFDLRVTPRLLASVPFAAGASMVAWHPKFSATVLIASSGGQFTLADTTSHGFSPTHQVMTEGDALVDCAISSTGEAIAFGGSGGYAHLWSSASAQQLVTVNRFSEPLEVPPRRPTSDLKLAEHDSFSAVPELYCHEGKPISAFDGAQIISAGLPPRAVHPSVLAGLKQVDFVGYATNPHARRGLARGEATKRVSAIRNLRRSRRNPNEVAEDGADAPKLATVDAVSALPSRYRRLLIRQQTGVKGVWNYDFSVHNPTAFAGLENGIANCYTNPLWQVLNFIPELRAAILDHVMEADKEFCLTCELSFLFRMLDDAKGSVCQASNLIRALRQNREAAALGLLEGQSQRSEGQQDIEVNVNKERAVDRRLQTLQRFLLEQLHRESSGRQESERPVSASSPVAATSALDRIFGMDTVQRTQCLPGAPDERLRHSRTFQVELQYPPASDRPPTEPQRGAKPSVSGAAVMPAEPAASESARPRVCFADVLASSLRPVTEMRAWFNEDRGYQVLRQTRVPLSLPKVLVVSCNLRDRANMAWWAAHQDGDAGERPWLPSALRVSCDSHEWQVAVSEADSMDGLDAATDKRPGVATAAYELAAVVWQVHDGVGSAPQAAAEPLDEHVVAHVKVPMSDLRAGAISVPLPSEIVSGDVSSPPAEPAACRDTDAGKLQGAGLQVTADIDKVADAAPAEQQLQQDSVARNSAAAAPVSGCLAAQWLLFNDFAIYPAEPGDVLQLYGAHKIPVLLYYRQVGTSSAEPTQAPAVARPVLTATEFYEMCLEGSSPATGARTPQATFVPLAKDEAPAPGMLLGLDAEFVALSQPDRRLIGDEYVEVRPARLGLARISVVRGEGPRQGTACIDDYVRSLEPVTDYLTKWSGLVAGDLDPAVSRHHLTSLKRAYMKLRHLVDAGCVFVGHDLQQDFRMINIVVPQEQVIDTVHLFRLPRQRKLSLRFLASYLLRQGIQQTTHDSIEDACAAVLLLHEARRMQAAGTLRQKLQELYAFGKEHGWGAVLWRDGVPEPLEA